MSKQVTLYNSYKICMVLKYTYNFEKFIYIHIKIETLHIYQALPKLEIFFIYNIDKVNH